MEPSSSKQPKLDPFNTSIQSPKRVSKKKVKTDVNPLKDSSLTNLVFQDWPDMSIPPGNFKNRKKDSNPKEDDGCPIQ